MTSPIGGTHFRRNEYGKVVGLDWTKHDDGKRPDPNTPKPKPKPAPKPRVKAGTCKHGHDVTSPDARYQNGQCKECVARRSRERQERRRAERIAAGLPVAHRDPTTCKRGHDVTLPDAFSARGECLECAREASREWYRRNRAKGPRPPAGECKRGHDLTLPDGRTSDGKCRECVRMRGRAHAAKKRAERKQQ